jgi:hypothetical protein
MKIVSSEVKIPLYPAKFPDNNESTGVFKAASRPAYVKRLAARLEKCGKNR